MDPDAAVDVDVADRVAMLVEDAEAEWGGLSPAGASSAPAAKV